MRRFSALGPVKLIRPGLRSALLGGLGLVAMASTTLADIHTWTGAGANKLWSNPANWVAPPGPPAVGEQQPVFLVFPSGVPAAALRSTNNIARLIVDTIALNGDNYHLAGTGGGAALPIRLGFLGSGTGNQIESSLTLVSSNDIVFNLAAGADLTIQSIITGPGSIWKTGDGSTVTLSGLAPNTYAGLTRVDGGLLRLQNGFLTGTVAIPGPLIIGDTNGHDGSVQLLANDQISDSSAVSIAGDSDLLCNGHNDGIGSLDMIGGTIYTDGGLLTLNGNVTYHDSPVLDGGIAGRLNLGLVSRTFNIVTGRLNVTANIESAGPAGIIKEGFGGLLALWGTNTYSGHTTINSGEVALHHNSALGTPGTGAQGTTVNPGAVLSIVNGVTITGELLQLGSKGLFGVTGGLYSSGTCAWNGDVLLVGDSSVAVEGTGRLTINGVIDGSHSLAKIGASILRLGGGGANTYSGGTFVNAGTLQLAKAAGVDAIPGALTIGNDLGGADADVVQLLADSQIPDDAPITIHASGLLDGNAHVEVLGPITLNGGHLDSGSATTSLLLGGDVIVNANTNAQARIDGGIFLYGNTNRTFATVGHYFSPDLKVGASIAGAATAALLKTGVGEMALFHTNNTYSGVTLVQRGSLQLNPGSEPGNAAGGTVVSNGAFLGLFSGTHVGNEPLTLHGNVPDSYCFFSGFGSNSWAGPITLADHSGLSVFRTNDVLNLSGRIAGPGGLTKTGPGWLILSGVSSNSFTGGTFVDAGRLVLAHLNDQIAIPGPLTIGDGVGGSDADIVHLTNGFNQIHGQARVIINSSGRLDMWAATEIVGSIEGAGLITFNTGILGAGFNGLDTIFSGRMTGNGGFNQDGPGTLRLAGNSPLFTGVLYALDGGTLRVDGLYPNAGAQTYTGGTLGGTGQVQSVVAHTNSTVGPGASAGQLKVSQGVTFQPGSIYQVELNGLAAGLTYDQISMNGPLILSNATLMVTVGFNSSPGDTFSIINNNAAGTAAGSFAGLPQNAILTVNGAKYRISYTGGSGNDVTLTHLNTAPLLTGLSVSPLKPEGSPVNLSGGINEPDAGDTVRLIINWGDGSGQQTNSYLGSTALFNLPHTYADDNPTGTPQDNYVIVAYLQDPQGAISPSLNATTTISNVPPTVSAGPNAGLVSGRRFTSSGSFTDRGTDTWTGTVNYGDGSGTQSLPLQANQTFSLGHDYPSNGIYTVTVTVRDDDLGVGTDTVKVVLGLHLSIAREPAADSVALLWPAYYTGMTLQCATILEGSNWVTVAEPPGIVSNQWIVHAGATNPAKFFRLTGP